jgi:hypothetical protein
MSLHLVLFFIVSSPFIFFLIVGALDNMDGHW